MFWMYHIHQSLVACLFVRQRKDGRVVLDCVAYDFHVGDTFYDSEDARKEGVAWSESGVKRTVQIVGVPAPTKGNPNALVEIEHDHVYRGRVVATTRKTITAEELVEILLERRED